MEETIGFILIHITAIAFCFYIGYKVGELHGKKQWRRNNFPPI